MSWIGPGNNALPSLTDEDRATAQIAGLTDAEAQSAKAAGLSFLRYAQLRDVRTLDQWAKTRESSQ